MSILANVKELREARGLSQRDLARESGVAQATVGQIERGERSARPSTVRKLAKGLGIEPTEFMFLFGTPDNEQWVGEQEQSGATGKGEIERYVTFEPRARSLVESLAHEQRILETFDTVDEALAALHLPQDLPGWSQRMIRMVSFEVRERLDSNNPEDVSKAGELALAVARKITENINKRWNEYEASAPQDSEDPSSVRRLETLRTDLHLDQRWTLEVIEELLEVHSDALLKLQVLTGSSRTPAEGSMTQRTGQIAESSKPCPYCANQDTKVIDYQRSKGKDAIRRRRECLACEKRFTTYERLKPLQLKVLKRDGTREPFDRAKLQAGLMKACAGRPVPEEEIDLMVDKIEAELRERRRHEVTSRRLGDMALLRLRERDMVSYLRFATVYRQYTDVEELEHVQRWGV